MKMSSFYVKQATMIALLFLLYFAWIEAPAGHAFGQNFRNTITGYVFDQQRSPVSQAAVELMNEVNSVIQRTRTDGSGRYFFSGLSAGRFSIRVIPLGTNLEEQTQEVEIINYVASGSATSDNAQKDFYLKVHKNGTQIDEIKGVIYVQEVPKDAQKSYEKAMAELNENKTDLGIQDLEAALKIFPTYYAVLERLGREYVIKQKFELARDIYARAVAVNARSLSCWYGLSFVNYALKQSKAAVESAQKANELAPNSVNVLLIFGISLRLDKRYEEAEKALLQAKKIDNGKNPDINWNLALLYAHNLKKFSEAADELELYLKINPNAPNPEGIRKLIKQFRGQAAGSNFAALSKAN